MLDRLVDILASRTAMVLAGSFLGASLAWDVQSMRLTTLVAEFALYRATSEKLAAEQELLWLKEKENAENEARTRLAALEAERTHLSATALRLRGDVAALRQRLANAPAAACLDAAATLGELLGACQDEYRSMAAAAQGHAADLETLNAAWPKVEK
jgi:molecular chaperone GrpE (heat shock protein)